MSRTHQFFPIGVACLVAVLAFGLPLTAYAQEAPEAPPAPEAENEAYEKDGAPVTAVVVPGTCAPVVGHWAAGCPTTCHYHGWHTAARSCRVHARAARAHARACHRAARAHARACRRAARAHALACRRAARAHAHACRRAARRHHHYCAVTPVCW